MRLWTVHEPRNPANAGERADRTIFVKDGFSWPGFLVPLPWLLFQRLWLGTLIYGLLAGAAGFAGTLPPLAGSAGLLLALAANLYAGLEGNDLRRRKLAKSGYTQAGSVLARDRTEAELAFFTERGAPDAAPAPQRPRAGAAGHAGGDVLGLFPQPGGPR
jgi:hypothetical protein